MYVRSPWWKRGLVTVIDTRGIRHTVSGYHLHPQIFIKIFVENFVENFLIFSVKYILIFSIFVLLKKQTKKRKEKNMKMKTENLSEKYSERCSCRIVKMENEEKSFIVKLLIEQGNSYNHCNIYLFSPLQNKWELFLNEESAPNLKFNSSYVNDEEKRVTDHKRVLNEAKSLMEKVLERF